MSSIAVDKSRQENHAMLDDAKKTTAEVTKARLLAAMESAQISPADLRAKIEQLSNKPLSRQTVWNWLKTGRIDKLWLPYFERATGQNLGFSAAKKPVKPDDSFTDGPMELSPEEIGLIEDLRMLEETGRADEVKAIYKTVHESAGVARKMKDHILKKYLPAKEPGRGA
jgi:hypothetical protein